MRLQPNRNETFVERTNYGQQVDIHVCQRDADGNTVAVAGPLTFTPIDPNGIGPGPLLSLHPHLAQLLADQLWAAGFRPTQGQQSEGQLGAIQGHLQDMRAIVASFAEVELPGVKVGS